MDIVHIDRFVKLLAVAVSMNKEVSSGISRAFASVLDGPRRMNYLSAARVHRCLLTLLPCWLSWRGDPAVCSRLRTLAREYDGRARLELLIFIAVPDDPELEQLFCEAVKAVWDAEMKSIREYVQESCGGSPAHFDDEVGGAHLSLFPLLIQFGAFGYTKQFSVIPKIPSHIGPAVARYQQFVEPMVRGSDTMRIALEHLLPPHVLPQPAPERLLDADQPMPLRFHEAVGPKLAPPEATEPLNADALYAKLLDAGSAKERRTLLKQMGSTLLEPKYREIVPILLRDEDKFVGRDMAEVYLSEYAAKAGPLAAINHGLALSFHVSELEVFASSIYRLLDDYGRSC